MESTGHWVVGWKTIDIASRYAISTDGDVRRIVGGQGARAGHVLNHVNVSGYPAVNLYCDDGRKRTITVHRLLGIAFLKKDDERSIQVAHEDGDSQNFRLSNLTWKTVLGNALDKIRHGTIPRGERQPMAKLTDATIAMIKAHTGSQTALATELGISQPMISRIKSGKRWKHVT